MDAPKSDVDRGREKSSTDFQVLLTCSTAGTPLDDRVLWCTLFTSVDSIIRSQAQSERAHTEEEKSLAFLWVCPDSQSVISLSRSRPALTPPARSPAPPLPVEHKYRVLAPGGYSIVASEVNLSQRTQGVPPVPCRFDPARRSNAFFLVSSLSMYGVAITMRQKVVPCSQCAVPCREFTFVLATVSTLYRNFTVHVLLVLKGPGPASP